MFLFVTLAVQAIRRDIETTREIQKPIVMAWGMNVFLDLTKKK